MTRRPPEDRDSPERRDQRHDDLVEVNSAVKDRVAAIIAANYTNARYEDPEKELQTRIVTNQIKEVLREKNAYVDALSDHFFSDNFSVEGLPLVEEAKLAQLKERFPYLEALLSRIATKPNSNVSVHLNSEFFGVSREGKLKRKKGTVSLRSQEYYCKLPEETAKKVQEQNSTLPVLTHIREKIQEHGEAMKKIQADTRLDSASLNDEEVLALAMPLDHLRNHALFLLNILLIAAKSTESPDLLKGVPGNTYLQSEPSNATGNRRTKIYTESVDRLLASSAGMEISKLMADDFEKVIETITAIIEAYYGFILTRDPSYLKNFDLSNLEYLDQTILPKVEALTEAFEGFVNESVAPGSQRTLRDNRLIKREFYKKILRHERDGDHPGVNTVNVISRMDPNAEKHPDLVCGLPYGGIEYPILYRAISRIKNQREGRPIKDPDLAFIVLSNYNLGYNPAFTPRLEAHAFPSSVANDLEGKNVLIMDDNIITGKTNTQVEVAFRAKGAKPQFVVNDLNLDPHVINNEFVMSANLEELANNAVRPIAKRNVRKDRERKLPDFMNGSRYFT